MKKGLIISIFILILSAISVSAVPANCSSLSSTNQSACEVAYDSSCTWYDEYDPYCANCCAPKGCWDFQSQSACDTASSQLGCTWETDSYGSWCEEITCYSADFTNQTYCETTINESYGVGCVWTVNQSLCDPPGGYFSSCATHDNDSYACSSTGFCEWNSIDSTCDEPEFYGFNPSCSIFSQETDCAKITGCSWTGTSCTGQDDGVSCDEITNKTLCNGVPILSTCCSWTNGTCGQTISPSCWDNLQPPPVGAQFCEDYNAFTNETLCGQLASAPWYMPCAWNNATSECGFNGGGFFNSFDDINSQANCEAAGGLWRSETYDQGGVLKKDEWCEFNFGNSGNCDSSCWACEYQPSGIAWNGASAAEGACGASATGFCEFSADTNAPNGYGYCDPQTELTYGGGDCNSNCRDCDFMNSPATACNASYAGCKWTIDPADSSIAWCEKENAKTCDDDCWSCYGQSPCETYGNGGSNACAWDANLFCKPSGFSGEICFDGLDNDGDGLADCADPGCGFDTFCGGSILGDCGSYSDDNQATCEAVNTTFGNCVWVVEEHDDFNDTWCGMPGEQCWLHDDDESVCNVTTGCGWDTGNGGFCEVNLTDDDACEEIDNQTGCDASSTCGWNPGYGGNGWCEHAQWECEWNATLRNSQSACEANANCMWDPFPFYGDSSCTPKCFSYDDNQSGCGVVSGCEWVTGLCEPDFFLGDCPQYDHTNSSTCEANAQCKWFDPICENVFMVEMYNNMQGGPPHMLGTDGDDGVNPQVDITGFGLKDMGEAYGLGTLVEDVSLAAFCNNYPLMGGGLGVSNETAKFYWYVDSDGTATGGCTGSGVSSNYSGFEFLFTYEAVYSSASTAETRLAYRCVSGSWALTNVPLSGDPFRMCNDIGGGMVAIEKESMEKFSSLISDTADFRFLATTANASGSRTSPTDEIGPVYFSQGTIDYAFEDCTAVGQDLDGDGLDAENDPDCFDYFRYGYVPIESGPQCADSIDNDNDGLTDCADDGCGHDPYFCSGSLDPDPNDNTAPNLVWLDKDVYPDGAVIRFDTDEPANGSVLFYNNDENCTTLNATLLDPSMLDPFVPDFKQWHDTPIDNFAFNPQAIGFAMTNATTYYFKVKNCDPSNNCALSRCMNFTSRNDYNDCVDCRATVDFDYTPTPGAAITDPLGNIVFSVVLPNGSRYQLGDTALSFNYTDTVNSTLELSNPNSTTNWVIKFKGVNLKKLSQNAQNMASTDIKYSESGGENYVGMDDSICQTLIQELRPKTLEICMPGNEDELWQCDEGVSNCVEKTSGAVNLGYNSTDDNTCWKVPSDWGC